MLFRYHGRKKQIQATYASDVLINEIVSQICPTGEEDCVDKHWVNLKDALDEGSYMG